VFSVGGEAFPAHVLNLPTIVESYKTYDDIHLVKSNDIGQVPSLNEGWGFAWLLYRHPVDCGRLYPFTATIVHQHLLLSLVHVYTSLHPQTCNVRGFLQYCWRRIAQRSQWLAVRQQCITP
jgi:TAFII55 protein conserved region